MFEAELAARLEIPRGVTAIIGSGGKTTLLRTLAAGLPGTVLLCTTTHILPFDGLPLLLSPDRETLAAALNTHRVVCAGVPEPETGKLTALPYALTGLADYVLVEADGSRGYPLKGHAGYEPVIPPEAGWVVQVVGLSGLEQPICRVVHRPEIFAGLLQARPGDAVTPARLAAVLNRENLADVILLNQAEDWRGVAGLLRGLLRKPAVVCSLKERWLA